MLSIFNTGGVIKTWSPGVSVESISSDPINDALSSNSSEKQQVHELVETEKAVASSPLKSEARKDQSSSESSTSDDWSEDETIQLMRVLASIDQGVFDEIPRRTHDIWKKVSGKMGSRSPTACHKQMGKFCAICSIRIVYMDSSIDSLFEISLF
jgi:hypothetical protein